MNCWYKIRDKVGFGLFQCWSQYTDEDGSYCVAIIVDKINQNTVEVAAEKVSFATTPPWTTNFEVRRVYMCREDNKLVLTFSPKPADEILGSNILIEGLHI
jgi:hypothetical protein